MRDERAGTLAQVAALMTLALMWLNYLLTARWAHFPGALHGPRQLPFVAILVATTLLVAWRRWSHGVPAGLLPSATFAVGTLVLSVSFFVWFPPATWAQLPALDNWPARYQSTMDQLALYRQGVACGWEWRFLGGYHLSSDITVTLSALAALPIAVFGQALGFHLLHALLLLVIPALLYLDLHLDDRRRDTALLGAGLAGLTVTSWFSYFLTRSGDTNSLAGTACVMAALAGSHARSRGRKWGGLLLIAGLVLVNYSHAGFFLYALMLLVLESLLERDWRIGARAAVAAAVAVAAALPLTWESWRYPAYFTYNNVMVDGSPFRWTPFLRQVYYNIEILFLPGRWFNDFSGLATVCLPVVAFMAWRGRGRARFHAWAVLLVVTLLRLNTPESGYAFVRPIHLLAVFVPGALAGFLTAFVGRRAAAWAVVGLVTVYLGYYWIPVPHVPSREAIDPALVAHVRGLDGALVLLENTFHRDMDLDPVGVTEPTPFSAHLEGYLAAETGKRLYAGLWDGWQWSPFRRQLLSGGAFQGRAIGRVPPAEFVSEMKRWGIRHLLVWSRASTAYLSTRPEFVERWREGRWVHFELRDADSRSVVTASGRGWLGGLHALGATVSLEDVREGDLVVVRTNFYPAWTARTGTMTVPLHAENGQIAFYAPAAGAVTVALEYPRRFWLLGMAIAAIIIGSVVLAGPPGGKWSG